MKRSVPMLSKIKGFLKNHYLIVTLFFGSTIVVLWTLFRFWTERSIFDLVGQQVVAREFLENGFMDATLGATHYIAKIFFVYVPYELLHIEPRLGLIVMTLFLNIAAFIAIVLAVRSIARSLGVFNKGTFVLAALWLASIAGSVFWIQFANSRNIEVAAGMWVLAIGLRFIGKPTLKLGVVWFLLIALAFLMDPLQVYMTGLPFLLYILALKINDYRVKVSSVSLRTLLWVLGIFIGGYVVSTLSIVIIESVSGVRIIDSHSSLAGMGALASQIMDATKGLILANVRMFGGYVEDGGRLRQAIALLGLLFLVGCLGWFALKGKIRSKIVVFLLIFTFIIQGVYFASGQTLKGDTSRYLIMMAPIIMIALSVLPKSKLTKVLILVISVVVVVNIVSLVSLATSSYQDRFSSDERLSQVAEYINNNQDVLFYGSMDTALPASFYNPQIKILPLSCSADGLKRADTFFPESSFSKYETREVKTKALIFDIGGVITNHPVACSIDSATVKLGNPISREKLGNGMEILYYPADRLSF
ncbi:MAG: hypothetical protein WAQ27_01100 [Candidatus Microsaccharimonas sp.]